MNDAKLERLAKAMADVGPWFSKTWWGKRHTIINLSVLIGLLMLMLWGSFR
jgi:hypothetical protein